MYQVTGASSLEFKRENVFSSSDGTLIVNLTYEGEGRFLGIPHAEDVVNLGREFGNYKVVRMGNLKIMSIFDRNFPEQNVSQSKLKSLLMRVKKYALSKNITNISFNELNLVKYNLSKLYVMIEKIFCENRWKVSIHLNNRKDFETSQVIKSVRRINSMGKNKPIIECRVGKLVTAGLVDTGADVSIVDFDFIKDKGIDIQAEDKINIIGVTGSNLEVVGSCNLKIGFRGQILENRVFVVRNGNMSIPFLFGCDFLRSNRMVIDFSDEIITLNGKFVRWLSPDGCVLTEEGEGVLVSEESVYIGSGTGQKLSFRVKVPLGVEYFCVQEVNQEIEKLGCKIKQKLMGGIFPVNGNRVEIDIINESFEGVKFFEGFIFGRVVFVREERVVVEYAKVVSVIETKENDINEDGRSDLIKDIIRGLEIKEDSDSLKRVLERNIDVFGKNDLDIGRLIGYEHRIDLNDDIPVASRPYRTPHSKMVEIDGEVEKLLKSGVIEESKSAYSAPCLLVYKKSGKPRLVIDYRKINKKIQPIKYPLPHLETTLQNLGGNSVFTTLDLLSGYHQIPLRDIDYNKTAFTTGRGLYHYRRVPFGMITSGAAMQYAMEKILGGLNGRICQTYVDDIVIYGRTLGEHDENVNVVLNRLKESGFKVNLKKCKFRMLKVECLGHVISGEGITPNPGKVKDIQEKRRPRSVKDVRSFMGMVSYYRRFVKDFAKISRPLTELTKKDVRWKWSEECEEAYRRLIDEVTHAPILVYPDYEKTFYVTTDASGDGIGAVLSQKHEGRHRPIAYYSRGLIGAERRYPVYELEGLAIKSALQKFKFYILGYKVIVRTDNQPVLYLLKSKECQGRVGKYMASIMEFDPKFEYIRGKDNHAADFLSRNINCTNIVKNNLKSLNEKDLILGQGRDKYIQNMKNKINYNRDFKEINGLIYKIEDNKYKLWVPGEYVDLYIDHFHAELGCHEGMNRTIERLKRYVYWVNLEKDVIKKIRECHICKLSKPSHVGRTTVGEFPRVTENFSRVHIDITGPFKRTFRGHKYLLVGIDAFSHWCFIRPLKRKDAETVSRVVEEELMFKGRTPKKVICDLGKEFNSRVFKELCERYHIEPYFCAPYYHASNGLVERLNLQIENAIRCLLLEGGGNWDIYINKIEKSLNSTIHGTVGFTPFEVVCGEVCPVDVLGVLKGGVFDSYARDEILEKVQNVRDKKIKEMLKKENNGKKYRKFNVGEMVYVRIPERVGKLGPIYKGPVEIVRTFDSGYSYGVVDEDGVNYRVHINNIRR